jgi:3-hydroxyacyl-CoA dehydrogenase
VIERVGVVGCGLMGSGIAEVSARAGLDVVVLDADDAGSKAGRESLYAEFREPLYAPPPLLSRMVDAGLLGRKTGRGFLTYDVA